jgi:hypothetical protein
MASDPPPGGNGTIIVMGRDGKVRALAIREATGRLPDVGNAGAAISWRCLPAAGDAGTHSDLMFAALMIGHHFSISAFWKPASASGVC